MPGVPAPAGSPAPDPDRIVEWLWAYEAVGVEHAIIRPVPHRDLGAIDLLAREVLPAMQPPAPAGRA